MCFNQCNSSCFHSETFFFPPFWKKRLSGIALKGKKGHFSLKAISYKSFKQGLNFVQIYLPVYDACHLCKPPWKRGLGQSCSVLACRPSTDRAAGGLIVDKAGHSQAGFREAVPVIPLIKLSTEALGLCFSSLCVFKKHCVCWAA